MLESKKAFKLAQIENEKGGGKSISDTDFKHAIDRVMKATTNEELQINTSFDLIRCHDVFEHSFYPLKIF